MVWLAENGQRLLLGGSDILQVVHAKKRELSTRLLREQRTDYPSPEKLLALQTEIEFVHEDPTKADVFSAGVTLLEMLILETPTSINK
jgi:hypothetical protein